MLILNIANISDLSRPSAFSISARTTTRRVVRSEAELMALMRALKTLFGTAETLASISWPIRTCAISCSKIWAFSHIVERSAIVYSASPESALTCCPGPTLRETTVPLIGAVIVVTRLSVPICSSFEISASVRPTMRRRARAASSVVSADRKSFSALASCASAACRSLDGAALPSWRSRTRFSTICARLCCERCLSFCRLRRDEVVLREQLLGAVDFQAADHRS